MDGRFSCGILIVIISSLYSLQGFLNGHHSLFGASFPGDELQQV